MPGWVEWHEKWHGTHNIYEYREGRTVVTVQPDFGGDGWYWSVHWPKQNHPPKKSEDGSHWVGGGAMARLTRWGKAESKELAQKAAIEALQKGRESTT